MKIKLSSTFLRYILFQINYFYLKIFVSIISRTINFNNSQFLGSNIAVMIYIINRKITEDSKAFVNFLFNFVFFREVHKYKVLSNLLLLQE